MRSNLRALGWIVVAALLWPQTLRAEPGDELSVHVMTFGPGTDPFSRFGHTALWVHDEGNRRDVVYNFGTFNFDSPLLIIDFLQGRFQYWLSRGPLEPTLAAYRYEDRSIVLQELELTPAERVEILRRLEENARPENRYYKFDYFFDNCSTRIRDIVDRAAGGAVREQGRTHATMTHREHALRLAHEPLWEYVGLALGLGPLTDTPRDRWAEAFVPEELEKLLRDTQIATPQGPRPLVKVERRVHTPSERDPSPAEPPVRWPWAFILGLLVGVGALGLGYAARRRRGTRVALGVLVALYGFLAGLVGASLTLLWGFTDHAVSYRNENLFLFPPWAWAFVILGVALARGKKWAPRATWQLAAASLAFALLGVALKLLPWLEQDNTLLVVFALPVWAGIAAAAYLAPDPQARGQSQAA